MKAMRSLCFVAASLFCLALSADISNARKDRGEYWQHASEEKSDCHTSHVDSSSLEVKPKHKLSFALEIEPSKKSLVTDFEPRPNLPTYVDGLKPTGKKSLVTDFEPRSSASTYVDSLKPIGEKSFDRDFEPRPSASTYVDGLKPTSEKSFVTHFEPRPNLSTYADGHIKSTDDKISHVKDFKPTTSATANVNNHKYEKSNETDFESGHNYDVATYTSDA